MLSFSLYDQCLISCPFQTPFHLYRIIQVVKFTHIDSVIRPGPVNVRRIFLFQQLIQQPVRIPLIAEQSHLHPVHRNFFFLDQAVTFQCIQNSIRDCLCNILEIIIKQLIVCIRIDESDFYQHRRHLCTFQDYKIRSCFHPQIHKPYTFQLLIDILCHFIF